MILPCFCRKQSLILAKESEVRQIAEVAMLGNHSGYCLKVAGEIVGVDNNTKAQTMIAGSDPDEI